MVTFCKVCAVLIAAVCSFSPATAHPQHGKMAGNLSMIRTMATVGDSYSAGIGAGKRLWGIDSWKCSRFSNSYGELIYHDPRFGGMRGRSIDRTACCGDTMEAVHKEQLPKLTDGKYDAITMTVGGNDVDFSYIANDCILGVYKKKKPKIDHEDLCLQQLARSKEIVAGLSFRYDFLLQELKKKLVPVTGRLYLTGYAKLVNEETSECDNVTFGWWRNKKNLTMTIRKQFNLIVDDLNKVIETAAERAGPQVVFVNFDSYFTNCGGRMCEEGVNEPEPNRPGLMFYVPGGRDTKWDDTTDLDADGFNETIHQDMGLATRTPFMDGFSAFLPIVMLRLLHPKSNAHRLIANLIIQHIQIEESKWKGVDPVPELTHTICPLQNPWSDTDKRPIQTGERKSNSASDLSAKVVSNGSVEFVKLYEENGGVKLGDALNTFVLDDDTEGDELAPTHRHQQASPYILSKIAPELLDKEGQIIG